MRPKFLLPLLLACLAGPAFAQAPQSPLAGTWALVSGQWTENGKETASMPGTVARSQLKMYSPGHFLFVGRSERGGKPVSDSFGGGTYTLVGEDYSETIQYHAVAKAVGTTLHFKLVIQGNTMTLTGPIAPKDQQEFGWQLTEVYQRQD